MQFLFNTLENEAFVHLKLVLKKERRGGRTLFEVFSDLTPLNSVGESYNPSCCGYRMDKALHHLLFFSSWKADSIVSDKINTWRASNMKDVFPKGFRWLKLPETEQVWKHNELQSMNISENTSS